MDLLKRELARKKKSVEQVKSSKATTGGRRYFRASELRRRDDESDDENERENRKKRKQTHDVDDTSNKKAATEAESSEQERETDKAVAAVASPITSPAAKLSSEEITQRLRSLGHPVKLFGETAADRLKRLSSALDKQKSLQAGLSEREEFALVRGHGIKNTWLLKDDDKETTKDESHPHDNETTAEQAQRSKTAAEEKKNNDDNDLDADDPHKRVYKYFKGLCKQWEEDLNLRPESVKKSVAGRNETKTFKQCKDYIRPMFKLCKNRRMDEGILYKLNKIVSFCLEEEFVKAHDTYIDISIGRAAWPIGVTMVGIHARTGRAKIESSNVAHVMNSELQRKYLTSVKRLMTYAQKKSSASPSKKVL